ncbi:MAG: glycosyltransferase family 39 protein [Pseudorhodoplanes sp.]
MLTVSLLIEILRTRPRLIFWLVALSQTFMWLIVPTIFYSAPPGDVAEVLAVGREFVLNASVGPPLAYWLGEFAMRATGNHIIGVYLLSQVCILIAYWAVFQLGRATVGDRHAMLAVLLMTGIAVFTVYSPDFGPEILMMPLWALALLFLWRASGEGKELYWLALVLVLGLMLLTSYQAILLVAAIVVFLAISARGRASVLSPAAAVAAFILVFMMLSSIATLKQYSATLFPDFAQLRKFAGTERHLVSGLRLAALILVAHAGAIILIVVASNLPRRKQAEAAAVARAPIDAYARNLIYFFAAVPPIVAILLATFAGRYDIAAVAPLLVLSGLAIVVAGGDTILLYHQRILGVAWFALLLLPPALAAVGVVALPTLFATDLKVAQPADALARYLTENFERRTGRRLEFVAGDARLASLIGLASQRRPHVIFEPGQGLPQLVKPEDAAQSGAVVVWRATDNIGAPPPQVRAMFPNIVPELPRVFERTLHGRAPLLRIGWGVARPRTEQQQ